MEVARSRSRRPDLSHLPHDLVDYLVCGYDLLVAQAAEDARQDFLSGKVCDSDELAERAHARARALGFPEPELEFTRPSTVLARLLHKFGHRIERWAVLPPDHAADDYVFVYMGVIAALINLARASERSGATR